MDGAFANVRKTAKEKAQRVQAKVAPNTVGKNSTAKLSNGERVKAKMAELREKVQPSAKENPPSSLQAKRKAEEAERGAAKDLEREGKLKRSGSSSSSSGRIGSSSDEE